MLLGIDSPTDIRSDRGRNNVWLSKRLEIDQDNLVLIYCIGLEVQLLGLTESLTMVLHLSLCVPLFLEVPVVFILRCSHPQQLFLVVFENLNVLFVYNSKDTVSYLGIKDIFKRL